MSFDVYHYLCLFFIYSFLGWCAEVAFQALTFNRLVNRGFLNGPVCPIYGVSCLTILLLLEPVMDNAWALFFFGMLIITAIELVGGWALDKIFHMRWWDYTDEPFNLGGYICLRFSILWGFAAVLVGKMVHPAMVYLVDLAPRPLGWTLCGLFGAWLVADLAVTLKKVLGLRKEIRELERVAAALRKGSDDLSNRIGTATIAAKEKAGEKQLELEMKLADTRQELEEARQALELKVAATRQELRQRANEGQQQREQRLEAHRAELDKLRAQLEELDSRKEQLVKRLDQSRATLRRRLPDRPRTKQEK